MNNRNTFGTIVRQVVRYGVDAVKKIIKGTDKNTGPNPDIIDMPQPPAVYDHKPGVKIAGILMAITGFTCGAASFFWSLIMLLGAAFIGEVGFGLGLFGVNCLLVGGCLFLGMKGVSMAGSVNRFSTYVKTIGQEELCNIKTLAARIGKSTGYVTKDVEKMIQKGWFCQGHLDEQKTCLMVTDQMYREYQRLEREKKMHHEAEMQRRTVPVEPVTARIEDEFIRKIRKCNDAIPGELISAKIDRMETLVKTIFDRVKQKPEMEDDIRRMTEYYLPTTIKLLETYAELDAQPADGENIRAAKKEIEDSLDTINRGFEKLLDSLFQDAAWDVSSDISVLKTMMAQEGLGEDGFKK